MSLVCLRSSPSNGSSISKSGCGVRRGERQHQAARKAFRQGPYTLTQNRPQSQCTNYTCDPGSTALIYFAKKTDHACHILFRPRSHAIRQIEHDLASLTRGELRIAPKN